MLEPGDEGWVQLRLEEPVPARARDAFVVRSFSPVTTIGGGRVAELHPPRRGSLGAEDARRLVLMLEGAARVPFSLTAATVGCYVSSAICT